MRIPDKDTLVIKSEDGKTIVMTDPTVPGAPTTLPFGTKVSATEPQQVGRYQVSERIGRGGMASVFRAFDPGIDRVLAIKFLHPDYCEDEGYRARFIREARAAGMLSHPSIVTIYDVGEITGRPYMAMELIEGEPLNDVIAKKGSLSIRETLAIGLQLAQALDYAHKKGLVHRDIKPANVMLLPDGQTIKVMDFGIAHFSSQNEQMTTRVGDVLGTPQYMSPEQTQGAKVDGRSDLFSVGVLLYFMLGGRVPFQGDSLVALAMKIVNDEPQPIEQLRPDTPVALRRIVKKCLAKSASDRFQLGEELAQSIRALQRARDGSSKERAEVPVVPLRLKWALMMGAFVFVVMALTGAVVHQQQKAALMAQVTDYGASLGRFIAAQSAVSALGDEWDAVEVSVQEIMKTGDFASVLVTDSSGVVKVSSEPTLLDKPYQPVLGESLGVGKGGVKLRRYTKGPDTLLGFVAPITFQGKSVGQVDIGLAERPLSRVANLSLTLMVVLVLITVLAVAVMMYFVANWFVQPMRVLRAAMVNIAEGQLGHRITQIRKDEFGTVYAGFNQMAQALSQGREDDVHVTTASAPKPNHAQLPSGASLSSESAVDQTTTLPDGRASQAMHFGRAVEGTQDSPASSNDGDGSDFPETEIQRGIPSR